MGTEAIVTIQCDQTAGICNIPVYAPSAAVVFFSSSALTENSGAPSTTFATTSRTKLYNTVTIDPSVLATSNGHWGILELGSTSKGSVNASNSLQPHLLALSAVLSLIFGVVALFGRWWMSKYFLKDGTLRDRGSDGIQDFLLLSFPSFLAVLFTLSLW